MTSDSPAHAFLLPRLAALVDEAVAHGIPREVAVAVLIDLVTSPGFDTAAPDPAADSAPNPLWQQRGPDSMVLVNGVKFKEPPDIGAQDEADFIKPIPWYGPG